MPHTLRITTGSGHTERCNCAHHVRDRLSPSQPTAKSGADRSSEDCSTSTNPQPETADQTPWLSSGTSQVLVAALILALRRAPKAADVEPARAEAIPAGLRPGTGSIIDARGIPASREVLDHGGAVDEAETAAQRGAAHQPW